VFQIFIFMVLLFSYLLKYSLYSEVSLIKKYIRQLKIIVFGMLYGIASPIPGLDGGTFFILFNIYDDFIMSAGFSNVRQKLPVVIPFLLACMVGLLGISNLMMHLLANYEMIMYFSFAGLILGCTPMIYKKSDIAKSKPGPKNVSIFTAALALMLLLAFTHTTPKTYDYIYYALYETSVGFVWIFIAAAISSVGMLIPGVGGAILMLVLGIYTIYIEALASLDWAVLVTLAAGMFTGILSGLKIVRKVLVTFPGELYCAILGFTLGSVFVVLPGFSMNLAGFLAIVFMGLFTAAAYQISIRS